MAPSSGGCPYERYCTRQCRQMHKQLHEHSSVGPTLALSRQSKYLIAGDQGPLLFPVACCTRTSLSDRNAVQYFCQAILAARHTRNLLLDRCLKDWFLWAYKQGLPVSKCWNAGCAFGIPSLSENDWSLADRQHVEQISGKVSQSDQGQPDPDSGLCFTEQHVHSNGSSTCLTGTSRQASSGKLPIGLPRFVKRDVTAAGVQSLVVLSHENNRIPKDSLQGALLNFGMPSVKD